MGPNLWTRQPRTREGTRTQQPYRWYTQKPQIDDAVPMAPRYDSSSRVNLSGPSRKLVIADPVEGRSAMMKMKIIGLKKFSSCDGRCTS